MHTKYIFFALFIFRNLNANLFGPVIDVNKLRRELSQERRMSGSELLNWVHAVHYVHTASAEEKKGTVEQLKSQVQDAKVQNEKIGQIIQKTQDYYNQIVNLKKKISNPTSIVSDHISNFTKSIGFRRLEETDSLLTQLNTKIQAGKHNQAQIQTSLNAAESGIRTLESVSSLFSSDPSGFFDNIKNFFKKLFGMSDKRRLQANRQMCMQGDHYAQRGHKGNVEALGAFCQDKHLDSVRDYALRNLEYLETVGQTGVDPKHMYKLIHDSDMVPFFQKMVDRVVTALLQIKDGTKKSTVELYEEIAKLKQNIQENKQIDSGVQPQEVTEQSNDVQQEQVQPDQQQGDNTENAETVVEGETQPVADEQNPQNEVIDEEQPIEDINVEEEEQPEEVVEEEQQPEEVVEEEQQPEEVVEEEQQPEEVVEEEQQPEEVVEEEQQPEENDNIEGQQPEENTIVEEQQPEDNVVVSEEEQPQEEAVPDEEQPIEDINVEEEEQPEEVVEEEQQPEEVVEEEQQQPEEVVEEEEQQPEEVVEEEQQPEEVVEEEQPIEDINVEEEQPVDEVQNEEDAALDEQSQPVQEEQQQVEEQPVEATEIPAQEQPVQDAQVEDVSPVEQEPIEDMNVEEEQEPVEQQNIAEENQANEDIIADQARPNEDVMAEEQSQNIDDQNIQDDVVEEQPENVDQTNEEVQQDNTVNQDLQAQDQQIDDIEVTDNTENN